MKIPTENLMLKATAFVLLVFGSACAVKGLWDGEGGWMVAAVAMFSIGGFFSVEKE